MSDTRRVLFETMTKLANKEISLDDANTVRKQCEERISTLKTEIDAVRRATRSEA